MNHMLETEVAKQNFTQIGYQPPQVSINPDSLVAEGFILANLKTAVVRPEFFDVGYRIRTRSGQRRCLAQRLARLQGRGS